MNLRNKTLAIIGSTLVSLIAILYVISHMVLFDGYLRLEHEAITQNTERLVNTINDQLGSMSSLTADWAHWDDTYDFMNDENDAYIEDNLMVETFINLELDLIFYMDTSGELFYGRAVNLEEWEVVDLPAGLDAYIYSDSPLRQHTEDPRSAVTGVIMLDEGPMLVASRPILTNEQEGPVAGTMVMGYFLNAAAVEALSDQLAMSLVLYPIKDANLPVAFQAAVDELAETPIYIEEMSEQTIAGYVTTSDIEGNPLLIWRIDMPRDILAQGNASLQYFLGSLLIVGLVFIVLMLVLLDRFVLKRISNLNQVVDEIRRDTNFSKRVVMSGQDELSNFGGAMNDMLDALAKAQNDLKEALKFKGQVLANVSHDARTPISVISLRAEMLESGMFGEVNPAQNNLIQSILSSSKQLLFFVNNLLDASQLEAGKLSLRSYDFDLDAMMKDVQSSLTPLAERKGLTLNVSRESTLPEKLNGDKDRLLQIIYNLVGNAVKFTDEGEVTVALSHPKDHEWSIRVSDTGPGIPQDAQQHLFEAFYQVDGSITRQQANGVGLGLSIVKDLVNLMGGRVTVTSEEGIGSTFVVTLPLKAAEQEDKDETAESELVKRGA